MTPALATVMLVETVFQYRTLIGKCELGVGLDWEEIDHVIRIEQAFAADRKDGRKFRRQLVEMTGIMRGDMINDRVDVIEIGPGGMVCRDGPDCPYQPGRASAGDTVLQEYGADRRVPLHRRVWRQGIQPRRLAGEGARRGSCRIAKSPGSAANRSGV